MDSLLDNLIFYEKGIVIFAPQKAKLHTLSILLSHTRVYLYILQDIIVFQIMCVLDLYIFLFNGI